MFSFGHCPNYLPPPPLSGNLYIFIGCQNGIYKVYFLNLGKGLPSPSFGQCPKENIFFQEVFPKLKYLLSIRDVREGWCTQCSWCETKVVTILQRSRGRREARGTRAEAEMIRGTQAEVGAGPDTETNCQLLLFAWEHHWSMGEVYINVKFCWNST